MPGHRLQARPAIGGCGGSRLPAPSCELGAQPVADHLDSNPVSVRLAVEASRSCVAAHPARVRHFPTCMEQVSLLPPLVQPWAPALSGMGRVRRKRRETPHAPLGTPVNDPIPSHKPLADDKPPTQPAPPSGEKSEPQLWAIAAVISPIATCAGIAAGASPLAAVAVTVALCITALRLAEQVRKRT